MLDTVTQPDGRIVGVGRHQNYTRGNGIIVRFMPDGSADPGFGEGGRVEVIEADIGFTSLVLDPDGRIVVAGYRDGQLLVRRFMPDGSPDASFASEPAATVSLPLGSPSPSFFQFYQRSPRFYPKIVRGGSNGYRVLAQGEYSGRSGCRVFGLTHDGSIDASYGALGDANLGLRPEQPMSCRAMARAADGSLVVVGDGGGAALAVRLLPDGAVDEGFDATTALSDMSSATAVFAPESENRIVVAGHGIDGAVSIVRLMPGGAADASFGRSGRTSFELPVDVTAVVQPNDMASGDDGTLLIAGALRRESGHGFLGDLDMPFVARLLGSKRTSPGAVGIKRTTESDVAEGSSVTLIIRRMGGSTGAVGVSYRASPPAEQDAAAAGEDFAGADGQLQWADGDISDRQISIAVPVDAGAAEEFEHFAIELHDPTGGAGLGVRTAQFTIRADGSPHGLFAIYEAESYIDESAGTARVTLQRKYYSSGQVSVTVRMQPETAAAGGDFAASDILVTWPDGDTSDRYVDIPIVDDQIDEGDERFSVKLVNPTGGAVVGPRASGAIVIAANDAPAPPPPQPPPSSDHSHAGSGGALDIWMLLILSSFAGAGWQRAATQNRRLARLR